MCIEINKEIIISGDLNCDISAPTSFTHTKKFLSLIENYQLEQLIKESTRITESSRTNIDPILTNDLRKTAQSDVIIKYGLKHVNSLAK